MQVAFTTLIGLPVFTESGKRVGKVVDAALAVDSHTVRTYLVRPHFFKIDELSISPSQVRSITDTKMIVDDAVLLDLKKSASVLQGASAWSAAATQSNE